MGEVVHTPEFLIWALEYRCLIRGLQDGSDPERTERQLRAARAVSEARREGRIFEGLCIRPPHGFRVSDALAIYGGLAAVEATCGNCPANALAARDKHSLAGCFGMVVLPSEQAPFHPAVDAAVQLHRDSLPSNSSITTPAWYGLWINSRLDPAMAATAAAILESVATCNKVQGITDLITALNISRASQIPLHVAVYPRGRVESTRWILAAHCPRCKVTWASEAIRRCEACTYEGPPAPQHNRKARGERPYFPLARLLGADGAAEFLVKYEAFQKQPGSTDQE